MTYSYQCVLQHTTEWDYPFARNPKERLCRVCGAIALQKFTVPHLDASAVPSRKPLYNP